MHLSISSIKGRPVASDLIIFFVQNAEQSPQDLHHLWKKMTVYSFVFFSFVLDVARGFVAFFFFGVVFLTIQVTSFLFKIC